MNNKKKQNDKIQIESYGKEFSENKFSNKITKFAKKAGVKTIYTALLLYYSVGDKNFPPAQRTLIIGALGYFVLPLDLIPDAVPIAGFSDDMVAMLFALKTVWDYITPEIQSKAKNKVKAFFGNIKDEDFILFNTQSPTEASI